MAFIMNNVEFVNKAKLALSKPTLYIMGCFGAPMNERNKIRYSNNYPYNKKRESLIMSASSDTFGFDCVNLLKGILWGWSGDVNATYGGAVYASNGVPDINEAGMIARCEGVSPNFSNIVPGEMLYMSGHAGIYIGDGLAIESSPKWKNGVQITAVANIGIKTGVNNRTWEKHGRLPWVKYDSQPAPEPTPAGITYSFEQVSSGSVGSDVKLLQNILRGLGIKGKDGRLPNIDGEFGPNTDYALKVFQKNAGISSDGIAGPVTWSKLLYK